MVEPLIATVRTRSIIRLAFYEATALFVLIVAFLTQYRDGSHSMQHRLSIFLLAVSAALFIFRNLPNRELILKECQPILQR